MHDEHELDERTGEDITPEPLTVSDQVSELTTPCVIKGALVELEASPETIDHTAPPGSLVPPGPPQTLIAAAPPRSSVPSVSHGLIGLSSLPVSPSLVVESLLVVPRVPTIKATPWLLLSSTPPWGLILWLNIRLLLLLDPYWLLQPYTSPWTFFSLDSFTFALHLPPEPPPSLLS
ncbi:hypothetical protein DPX16_16834 [Anabarilius grahami]|uniref:Uncharacterized protein n=1 Tax=Anabarilius grahami TaxID=495550 RepID=A0A3N0YSM9_ANAGA|nr:hypothetical protein DPX16_16834 [Anabarilius grahami]